MELLSYLPAAAISYAFFQLTHYPKGKIGKKLPELKIKRIQLSPSIKIQAGSRTIHFHHWMSMSLVLAISIPMTNAFLDSTITKGLLMGGIIQGLALPDAHKFIYRSPHTSQAWYKPLLKLAKTPLRA